MIFRNGADCVPAELRIATDEAMRDLGRELAARLCAGDLVIDPGGEARTVRLRGHGARWHAGLSGKQPASSADRERY